MKNRVFYFLIALSAMVIWSCGQEKEQRSEGEIIEPEDSVGIEKKVLEFHSVEAQSFPDAIIDMYSPSGNEKFKVGKVPFEFNIKNYPFGQDDPLMVSINGADPIAYQQPIFQKEFNTGTYRAVAFLVDKNGFALKEFGNYVDRDFLVGESRPFPDGDEPYLILNLPREEQEYQGEEEVHIDFLLIGGDLQADGLKVVIQVDGQTHECRKLLPVKLEGLEPGEHMLKIELFRENGEELAGIFSEYKRRIKIK